MLYSFEKRKTIIAMLISGGSNNFRVNSVSETVYNFKAQIDETKRY